MQLFGAQLHLRTVPNTWPGELTLMEPACRQLNTEPVMYQDFHASGAAVGKQVSAVRLRRTEHRNHAGHGGVGASAHVHRLGSEPDGVDTNHRNSSRRKLAQTAALSTGQVILTGVRGCWISRQILEGWACDPTPSI